MGSQYEPAGESACRAPPARTLRGVSAAGGAGSAAVAARAPGSAGWARAPTWAPERRVPATRLVRPPRELRRAPGRAPALRRAPGRAPGPGPPPGRARAAAREARRNW